MKLYLVTFDIDNTQFLVDTETETQAIQYAIVANQDEKLLGYFDKGTLYDLCEKSNYLVEDVNMILLAEIMKRNDCLGKSNLLDNVIVFEGE